MWWNANSEKRLRILVGDVVDACEKLKRRVDALELDYEALYDKVRSALQRVSKRAEVVEKAALQDNPPPEPGTPRDGLNGSGAGLTERQRSIQQQILKRRAGVQ